MNYKIGRYYDRVFRIVCQIGFCLLPFLFCACPSEVEKVQDLEYQFEIFRFVNQEYKDMIITTGYSSELLPANSIAPPYENGIYCFPKRSFESPYFDESLSHKINSYTFDLCELATESKIVSLHNKYFFYFPYTSLGISVHECYPELRNAYWKDICNLDMDTVPILTNNPFDIYEIHYHFKIRTLEQLTRKSRKTMTVNDIIVAVNKLIDEGNLDLYANRHWGNIFYTWKK